MLDAIRQEFFPHSISERYVIEAISDTSEFWQDASPLMNQIFPEYSEIGAYGFVLPEKRQEQAKALSRLYTQAHHEYFLFKTSESEAVGFSYGDMRDSQTFFMTSTGVLAEYQQQGIYSGFVRQLLRYLYAIGYERVVSNHQPNNRAVIIAKLKLGFNITAVNLDERWGAQVELTYLFEDNRREAYESTFALEKRLMPQVHL